MRLLVVFAVLALLVLIPFAIWGDALEAFFTQQTAVDWLASYSYWGWAVGFSCWALICLCYYQLLLLQSGYFGYPLPSLAGWTDRYTGIIGGRNRRLRSQPKVWRKHDPSVYGKRRLENGQEVRSQGWRYVGSTVLLDTRIAGGRGLHGRTYQDRKD